MTEYTTDIRDLDCAPLGKINGATYYELHQIVRDRDGVRETIGRASDWPLIKLTAEKAELEQLLSSTLHQVSESEQHVATLSALLTRSEGLSTDANCHVVELTGRLSLYERHIAALEAALAEAAFAERLAAPAQPTVFVAEPLPPQVAQLVERLQTPRSERDCDIDGRVACDYPGCDARLKPRGLLNHKRLAHKLRTTDAPPATPPAALPEIALELGEPPWRCADCHESTHARSLKDPARCIRCVVAAIDAHTNGHSIAA